MAKTNSAPQKGKGKNAKKEAEPQPAPEVKLINSRVELSPELHTKCVIEKMNRTLAGKPITLIELLREFIAKGVEHIKLPTQR